MPYLGWYGPGGKCWRYVLIHNGDRHDAILRLVQAVISGSEMELRETDKRPQTEKVKR